MSDKSRVAVKRDDALSARSARLVEVMRRITEEISEEVVQAIRNGTNDSVQRQHRSEGLGRRR
jgi:hypothetical protein